MPMTESSSTSGSMHGGCLRGFEAYLPLEEDGRLRKTHAVWTGKQAKVAQLENMFNGGSSASDCGGLVGAIRKGPVWDVPGRMAALKGTPNWQKGSKGKGTSRQVDGRREGEDMRESDTPTNSCASAGPSGTTPAHPKHAPRRLSPSSAPRTRQQSQHEVSDAHTHTHIGLSLSRTEGVAGESIPRGAARAKATRLGSGAQGGPRGPRPPGPRPPSASAVRTPVSASASDPRSATRGPQSPGAFFGPGLDPERRRPLISASASDPRHHERHTRCRVFDLSVPNPGGGGGAKTGARPRPRTRPQSRPRGRGQVSR